MRALAEILAGLREARRQREEDEGDGPPTLRPVVLEQMGIGQEKTEEEGT